MQAAEGYTLVTTGSGVETMVPARVLDTRPDGVTVDGVGARRGLVQAGQELRVQVTGRAGLPVSVLLARTSLTRSPSNSM